MAPGEALYVTADGDYTTRRCVQPAGHTPCIFEYVYLAREDSLMDDISVYQARLRMGEKLAQRILKRYADGRASLTGRHAARRPRHRRGDPDSRIEPRRRDSIGACLEGAVSRGLCEESLHRPHLHHAGPEPTRQVCTAEAQRHRVEFQGKNVLLVEDSIVRGTTTGQIVQQARKAGANKVSWP